MPCATPSRCSNRIPRSASAAAVKSARCALPRGSRSTGTSSAAPEQFRHARGVLHQHCADIGRDPAEILLSSHVHFTGDPAETAANAAALGKAGVELAIVILRPPHTASVLE